MLDSIVSLLRLKGFIDLILFVKNGSADEADLRKLYSSKTLELIDFYLPLGFLAGFVATLLHPTNFGLSYSFPKVFAFWGGLFTGATILGIGLLIVVAAIIRLKGVNGLSSEIRDVLFYIKGNSNKTTKRVLIGFAGLFLALLFLDKSGIGVLDGAGKGDNQTDFVRGTKVYHHGLKDYVYECPDGYSKRRYGDSYCYRN